MALVLCIGADDSLTATRGLILERAGHQVLLATNLEAVAQAFGQGDVDVVVIGEAIGTPQKRQIVELVRRKCKHAKILELLRRGYGSRAVRDGDDRLEVPPDTPEVLAMRVTALAENKHSDKHPRHGEKQSRENSRLAGEL